MPGPGDLRGPPNPAHARSAHVVDWQGGVAVAVQSDLAPSSLAGWLFEPRACVAKVGRSSYRKVYALRRIEGAGPTHCAEQRGRFSACDATGSYAVYAKPANIIVRQLGSRRISHLYTTVFRLDTKWVLNAMLVTELGRSCVPTTPGSSADPSAKARLPLRS